MKRTSPEILRAARETLVTAELGLRDLTGNAPERRRSGLRNGVVFGRAVTNVLENLRGTEPEFDAWYRPRSEALAGDPLMKFFYKLRSQVLKEGALPCAVTLSISNLSLPRDAERLGPPPPGASGFFAGDANGGIGWFVSLPDGTVEKYYASLPEAIGRVDVLLPQAPDLEGSVRAADLLRHYLGKMRQMVDEATETFGGAV